MSAVVCLGASSEVFGVQFGLLLVTHACTWRFCSMPGGVSQTYGLRGQQSNLAEWESNSCKRASAKILPNVMACA